MADIQSKGRFFQGQVISTKMQETAVVLVRRRVKHPLYKKVMTRSTKLHVHVPKEGATCEVGDVVSVQECRPISKTKCWVLREVIEKAS